VILTRAPVPLATGGGGEKDNVADVHGKDRLYGRELYASADAVLAASRTQTPR
jgi:hypothetical protein